MKSPSFSIALVIQ